MKFYMPARLYEESDVVAKHAKEITALGKKALIVTGAHSARKTGAQADLTEILSDVGVDYEIFDQVEENPSTRTIMQACRSADVADCDFVVGIGGGSPLDAAKAIALMLAHPDWEEEKLYQNGQDNSHLPDDLRDGIRADRSFRLDPPGAGPEGVHSLCALPGSCLGRRQVSGKGAEESHRQHGHRCPGASDRGLCQYRGG